MEGALSMQAIMESLFDVFYLVFAAGMGLSLLKHRRRSALAFLFGAMCLILGGGDAFHLVPRVMGYWFDGDFTAAKGLGTAVTSVTMTVFYLMLEYARRERYAISKEQGVLRAMWLLAAVRIALCFFPQNQWTSADAPLSWGIYRNIPFAAMGIITAFVWFVSAKKDKALRFLWLAVLLSFAFYFPVVLFADAMPIIGMLMLPKTIMYILMMVMFKKAVETRA